jgi:hypothetical protein
LEPRFLFAADGIEGAAEAFGTAAFNFNEDYEIASVRDDVDFAELAEAVIPFDYAEVL